MRREVLVVIVLQIILLSSCSSATQTLHLTATRLPTDTPMPTETSSSVNPTPSLPPADWVRVDANGKFTFFIPPDMEEKEIQGIDSFVGEYRSNRMRLRFDFGLYSDPLNYSGESDYQELVTTIGGERAKIVTFGGWPSALGFEYVAAVHFPDLGDGRALLTLWVECASPEEQEEAKKIFHAISFP